MSPQPRLFPEHEATLRAEVRKPQSGRWPLAVNRLPDGRAPCAICGAVVALKAPEDTVTP